MLILRRQQQAVDCETCVLALSLALKWLNFTKAAALAESPCRANHAAALEKVKAKGYQGNQGKLTMVFHVSQSFKHTRHPAHSTAQPLTSHDQPEVVNPPILSKAAPVSKSCGWNSLTWDQCTSQSSMLFWASWKAANRRVFLQASMIYLRRN